MRMPITGGQVVPDNLQGWRYEERQLGKWEAEHWEEAYQESYHTCSICKKDMRTTHYDNFCPNCGAKMITASTGETPEANK